MRQQASDSSLIDNSPTRDTHSLVNVKAFTGEAVLSEHNSRVNIFIQNNKELCLKIFICHIFHNIHFDL